MRRLKLAIGLASTASVLCIAATPAVAHEFTASRLPKPLSETEPGKTKGIGIGSTTIGGEERSQELKFGAYTILCAVQTTGKTIAEGAVSWATSQTFTTELKFSKCLTEASYGGNIEGTSTNFNVNPETKKSEPVKFVYHVNGFAELGSGETESEVEVGSGVSTFTIAGKVCKIAWPSQTVPARALVKPEEEFSAVSYFTNEVPVEARKIKQFPSGFKDKLVIDNNFKTMAWSFEEGQCLGEGGFEKVTKKVEAKSGIYKGMVEEEVDAGNLAFK
jgi:hypothetical protein